jgi:hypothetical protein
MRSRVCVCVCVCVCVFAFVGLLLSRSEIFTVALDFGLLLSMAQLPGSGAGGVSHFPTILSAGSSSFKSSAFSDQVSLTIMRKSRLACVALSVA